MKAPTSDDNPKRKLTPNEMVLSEVGWIEMEERAEYLIVWDNSLHVGMGFSPILRLAVIIFGDSAGGLTCLDLGHPMISSSDL